MPGSARARVQLHEHVGAGRQLGQQQVRAGDGHARHQVPLHGAHLQLPSGRAEGSRTEEEEAGLGCTVNTRSSPAITATMSDTVVVPLKSVCRRR